MGVVGLTPSQDPGGSFWHRHGRNGTLFPSHVGQHLLDWNLGLWETHPGVVKSFMLCTWVPWEAALAPVETKLACACVRARMCVCACLCVWRVP